MIRSVKFSNQQNEFFATLSRRVNNYFATAGIEKTANAEMIFKTIFMFMLYLVPFAMLLSGVAQTFGAQLLLWGAMGLGMAGIGLSVMHDANHGAYSRKTWVNNLLGLSLNIVGGHAMNWKVQHNVLHHTYTNIHDLDEDISPRGVLRMAPASTWRPMHRYQHWYAWFLYGLMTLVWIVLKDFFRLTKYQREGLLKKQKTTALREWVLMLGTKVIYFTYIFGLPMTLLALPFWKVFAGFFLMHYIAGFILAIIFQPAHVVEGTEYPMPDLQGNIENHWAIHQLHTTTNFGHRHRLLSWYVGGLNYQVEHHLFPNICHVHYRALAPIVEQTAKEFGLPYKSKETFLDAVVAHAAQLKMMGQKPAVAPVPA